MAESFNLNTFLNEYKNYNNRQYTAAENGKAAMEERDIQRAQEAVQGSGFLSLTLSEKMAELGIGERVMQQIGDTAIGAVTDIFRPLGDWLDKYENIFDEKMYNAELQANGKQMFFTRQALDRETQTTTGQRFVADF